MNGDIERQEYFKLCKRNKWFCRTAANVAQKVKRAREKVAAAQASKKEVKKKRSSGNGKAFRSGIPLYAFAGVNMTARQLNKAAKTTMNHGKQVLALKKAGKDTHRALKVALQTGALKVFEAVWTTIR